MAMRAILSLDLPRVDARGAYDARDLWVARLDGLDDRLRFLRTFVQGRRTLDGSSEFYALDPGLYEVQHAVGGRRDRYILRVAADGTNARITRAQAIALLREEAS